MVMNLSLHQQTRHKTATDKTRGKGRRMKTRLAIVTLAAFGSFFSIAPIYAEEQVSSDFELVVEATEESELDYEKLKSKLLQRYSTAIVQMEQAESSYTSIFSGSLVSESTGGSSSIPKDYTPWWQARANGRINQSVPNLSTDITSLFARALKHSSQIKVFTDLPLIRQTTIQEAQGPYDFRIFAEGSLSDLDEPVGDDLQTGGPLRYEENAGNFEYGVRKKFLAGTEVELKQNIGGMDTNSIYFNPEDQARSGTYLTISQPLLKRFGIAYNRAPIDLANIDHAVAQEELRRNVESHLLEVTRAYWGLYLERSLLLQKEQLAKRSLEIYKQMQQRSSMDVAPSLLARARSLVNTHELAAMQAEFAMLNAQSRIRALVNDPELLNSAGLEMTTSQMPNNQLFEINFDQALQTTLDNRPEVAQAIKHIQSAYLRLERSRNEMRPDLDIFFQTYVKGLEGDYEYGTAYSNQFDEGDPSFVGGLRFEYPLGNNGAGARNLRKKIEMRQLLHQLDTTVENVLLEAQVSYRELEKNYRSMVQGYQIMLSDQEEVSALLSRIDYLLADSEPYGDVLYRLMDASERLTDSEELFAKSELTYNYALFNLYRAMGILVSNNNIIFEEETPEDGDELPVIFVRNQ